MADTTESAMTVDNGNSEVQPQESLDVKTEVQSSTVTTTNSSEKRGVKRPSPDDDIEEGGRDDERPNETTNGTDAPKLSKNQQRKLKRQKMWEEKKQEKKILRKEKRHEKQEKKRLEREAEIAAAAAERREPVFQESSRKQPKSSTKVPISVIFDCQFEKYMMGKELPSLSNQITRCYSDNRNAQYPVHMFISSYGGQMKERHETILQNQFKGWKNVHFIEGDFIEAAAKAKEIMAGPSGGTVIDLLSQGKEGDSISFSGANQDSKKKQKTAPVAEPEADDVDKSIVYLTADSPYTLGRLEPNTCYVIGGIIDKNREKGLCYKIARSKNVRTAKLPIGQYMVMQSRHILATNHVMEIILQWLETGDWGTAFMNVIPMRKGGKLKEDEDTPDTGHEEPEVAPEKGQEPLNPVQVEGDNAEDGLEKNALSQQRWSAPPIEEEAKAEAEAEAPVGTALS
ncbi:guanine-1-methyltransferase-domain-containing protein [Daldinia eschscholtzii]|nr:guanine-1-methyltransferase-domain-containing protein [Daldinia eschscholtzii]